MRRFLPVFAMGVLALSVGCDQAWQDKRTFLASCEEVIMDRLKSPSSYRRINDPEVTLSQSVISDLEFEELMTPLSPEAQEGARARRMSGAGWVEKSNFVTTIEYDAVSAFGASLRQSSSCRSGTAYSGTPGRFDVSVTAVEVDGRTTVDWFVEQSRKLRLN